MYNLITGNKSHRKDNNMIGYKELNTIEEYIKAKIDFSPKAGLVLGSGLGGFSKKIEKVSEIPYSEIPSFPVSTVDGHNGSFIFGYIGRNRLPIVAMNGRVHYYEGYHMSEVVAPIRTMGMLGAKAIILTNAAGGINLSFSPGDLMIIKDVITTFIPNPLIGPNIEELGTRFPDMSKIFSPRLINILENISKEVGVDIREGIYAQCTGPSFETPAEINMLRVLGADAVGMSTACEAIAARHMGIEVCGVSCISNMAAGILDQPLTHAEVQETADKVSSHFESIILGLCENL